ncbi:MAG: ribonuclease H-like domain-containing protein [Chloroflexota bacterium]
MKAYLDIETTGLSPFYDDITVVGISFGGVRDQEVIQLVGKDIKADALAKALKSATSICTYNGERFDLRFIHQKLGVDLMADFQHHDLMHDCWANGLYGGLKAVEQTLGIQRKLTNIDGLEAVRLWWAYVRRHDQNALQTLLDYNKEDVLNLKHLERKLKLSRRPAGPR